MPFLPIATFEQVVAFDPVDSSTHTASPLVNAVAEVLHDTKLIECKEIAKRLEVDERKLSSALSLELGMTLNELLDRYRMKQALDFISDHPDCSPDQLAQEIGYASRNGISRFLYTKLGITPTGRKSNRSKDRSVDMLSRIRALRNSNLPFPEMIEALKSLR